MLPASDSLESLLERAKSLVAELKRLKSAEVKSAKIKNALADLAREWLRVSQLLKAAAIGEVAKLNAYDETMRGLLAATGTRARATALRRRLEPFADGALNDVVVPVIQYEGSPRQVAGRQLQTVFGNSLTADEITYVEEAARCVTVQCYRAAIIMLWTAAISRIHNAVVRLGFDSFNKAVDATTSKKGNPFNRVKETAKLSSFPELQRSRDADLIVIGMELFSYDLQTYQELDRLLGIRNDSAHPGAARPGALDVQQFATKVRDCVFDRIPA